MSKIIKVSWFKKITFLSLFVFLAGGILLAWSSATDKDFDKTAKAAFNPQFSRYEDTLSDTQTIAKYTYYVVNTSSNAAPGYFAMSLESFNQNPVDNQIEIVGVKQSFPVSLYSPSSNPTVINENVDQVSYDSGNIKYIKLVPGSACAPDPNGGCAIGSIPANMPIAVEISVKMKFGLTSPDVLNGMGKVVFPNGFDVNSIGWKINLNPTSPSLSSKASIDSISTSTQNANGPSININFTTLGYTNTPGGVHTHFYFNTENNDVLNKMYSGPSPYVLALSSIPSGASQICSIVGNPNHTVIQNSGNCVNLSSLDIPINNQTIGNQNNSTTTSVFQNSLESSFPAGIPETLQFTVNNTSSTSSDIFLALGLESDSWSDATQTTIKPTQDCYISLPSDLSFVGGCGELFDGSGFKINGLPGGASTQVKVSRIINKTKPTQTINELKFNLFSSLSNDFSAASNPSKTIVTFNSKYPKSLSITKEKVLDSQKFGGNQAFAQIVSPYTDVIFAINVKNQSQIDYTGVNIRDVLDQNTQDYFNNCSFSQAQSLNSVRINVVETSNLQGIAQDGLKDYTLNNLIIPAASDTDQGEIVFYVGCNRNNLPLPPVQKLLNMAQVVSFDGMADSFYVLPDDLTAKADANPNSSQNLKIEKSLVLKSNSQFTTGTQVTYKIKITNTSSRPSEEITVADLIQVPDGVLVHTGTSSVITDLVNPLQDGSTSIQVADISSGNFGLNAAYPLNITGTDSLGNTIRTFKINKLKGGDTFEFKYNLIFNGTFPTSCNLGNIDQIPAFRNIAVLSNLPVNNGIKVSGSASDIAIGGIPSFITFNEIYKDFDITLANNVIYQDSDLSDNIAIIDHTEELCFDFETISDDLNQQIRILSSNDIPNLNVVCLPVVPGTPTNCSFKLPITVILPNEFQIGIGDEIMSGCARINFNPENQNEISEYVLCKSVVTPTDGQSTAIFGKIGTGSRILTNEKLTFDKSSGLSLVLNPLNNQLEVSFNLQNTPFSSSIPSFEVSLDEGDNLASFEPTAILVNSDTKTTITNLVPCTSYKLKFSLNDNLGNTIASVIKDFDTSGCVDNKEVLVEKTVPISSTTGGSLKLTDGDDQLDLTLPPNFSTTDKKIQVKKLSQTESNINSLPKLPKSTRLAKNKTYDLKAFTGTSSLATTFNQPLNLKIKYTDQSVNLLDKDSLKIRSWDGTSWQDLTNCVNDKINKTVACETTHFSLFALSGQTALDTANIKWNFSQKSGLNAPFFKDATPISINLSNFTASRNNIPSDGEFVCKFEMTPIRASNPVTTVLADNIPYSSTTGCSTSITKAQRGNILKLNLKATITSTTNSTQKYTFNTNYMLNFKGAGIATPAQ